MVRRDDREKRRVPGALTNRAEKGRPAIPVLRLGLLTEESYLYMRKGRLHPYAGEKGDEIPLRQRGGNR